MLQQALQVTPPATRTTVNTERPTRPHDSRDIARSTLHTHVSPDGRCTIVDRHDARTRSVGRLTVQARLQCISTRQALQTLTLLTHGPPRKVTGPIRDTTPPPPTPGSIQSPPPHVDNQWPSSEYDPARTTPHHGGSGTCAARRPYQWPVRISIRPSGWAWPIQVIGLAHPSDWPGPSK